MNKKSVIRATIIMLACRAEAQPLYELQPAREGAILGTGLTAATAVLLLDHGKPPLTPEEIAPLSPASINGLDRFATRHYSRGCRVASDLLLGTTAAAPLALLLDPDIGEERAELGLIYLETMLVSALSFSVTKGVVTRYRPRVYNPQVPWADKESMDNRKSFFSGHTTLAFASAAFMASVYARYHPDGKANHYLRAGSLAAAGTTGILRILAGAHFPSDVVVGALVGSTCGTMIPRWHQKQADGAARGRPARGATPRLHVSWRF